MKKRLTILVTVPVYKRISEYVFYLAAEIKKLGGTFYTAVNGECDEKNRHRLEDICDFTVFRKNEDYDIGAYREIVLRLAEAGELADYEELVLMNDSFYGPFFSFSDMFDEMDCRKVDFWGLTAHPKTKVREDYYIEEHLQSYFLVVNTRMLKSEAFQQFWIDLPSRIASRELAIECFEKRFTLHFSKQGYSWASFIDQKFFRNKNLELNYNPYVYSSLEMIAAYHLPILKRSIIPMKNMEHFANWDDTRKCLQFIDEKTEYDMNLIWDDMLLRYDINMLKNHLHLSYIISSHQAENISSRLLFIVHSRSKKEHIPDFVFRTGDVLWSDELLNCSMQYLSPYSFICFLNFSVISEEDCYCDQRTIGQNLAENLIRDENYISSIIKIFKENDRLGILFAADPFFSEIFDSRRRKEWRGQKHDDMRQLVKRQGLCSTVSDEWMPETGIGSFWCRAELFKQEKGFYLLSEIIKQGMYALSGRSDETHEMMPGLIQDMDWLECLPYLCQHSGYLVGEVLSDDCAAQRLCNYQYALSAIAGASYESGGIQSKRLHDYHIQLCQKLIRPQLIDFCARHDYIYIYGAGEYGVIFAQLLNQEQIEYEGFLVSRGQYKDRVLFGKTVCYLDEVKQESDKVGIIAAVPLQVQPVIKSLCREQNFCNIFCFAVRIANI